MASLNSWTPPRAEQPADGGEEDRMAARKEAADYIRSVTGCAVLHGDARDLCSALADGVVLSRLINAAFPGAVPEVGGVTQQACHSRCRNGLRANAACRCWLGPWQPRFGNCV
jgi:hypothetical protein